MKKWEILDKKDVSPSKWYPIEHHKVKLGNGLIVDDYFVSSFGNVAMIFPLTVEGKVVLTRQYKHGIQDFIIEIPAGFQQKGKTIEETALAELEEEVGIKTTLDNLIPLGKVCNSPTKSLHVTYGFLAKNLSFNSTQKLDITEEIEILQQSPKEVIEMVKNGSIWGSDTCSMILKTHLLYPELFE